MEGRAFYVLTDHKPLTHSFSSKSDRYSPREIRHLDYVSQFTTDIRFIKGVDNIVADTLSRADINNISTTSNAAIDLNEIASSQKEHAELIKLRSASSLQFEDFPFLQH